MAKNLRANIPAVDQMIVYDINAGSSRQFAEDVGTVSSSAPTLEKGAGAEVAKTPRSLAEKSDVIITVLPEPAHVKEVVEAMIRPQLQELPSTQKRIFIDCSTIDPSTSRKVASAVHRTGQGTFVDAPMSGGVVGAQEKTLTFMLGAPLDLLDHVTPILLMMGRSVQHCGDQGAGLSAKLANNYLLALLNIATAEAMDLGIRCGLDAKVLGQLINVSTGRNWCSEVNNPVPGVIDAAPASREYSGGFGVSLMKKDLELAIAAAEEAGAKLQLHEKAREIYNAVNRDERYKDRDFSVVYQYLQSKE